LFLTALFVIYDFVPNKFFPYAPCGNPDNKSVDLLPWNFYDNFVPKRSPNEFFTAGSSPANEENKFCFQLFCYAACSMSYTIF